MLHILYGDQKVYGLLHYQNTNFRLNQIDVSAFSFPFMIKFNEKFTLFWSFIYDKNFKK